MASDRMVAVSILMALCVVGCPKKGGEAGDASSEAAAVAATDAAPAGPEASNADAVARFPDEASMDRQSATLQWPRTNVRKSPPSGEIIATLPKGATVTQIAGHDKYALVVFDNPKTAGDHLMGWVLKDVFSAQPAQPAPKGACPAGQTSLIGDEAFCGKVCKVDTDCVGGQACMGTASLALGDGGAGAQVHNCTAIARPDAGAPPPVAAADAGALPIALLDGGLHIIPPRSLTAGGAIVVDPDANKACPAGYVMVAQRDGKCHKTCTKDADCGNGKCARAGYCYAQ